jgi:hypothetical protein
MCFYLKYIRYRTQVKDDRLSLMQTTATVPGPLQTPQQQSAASAYIMDRVCGVSSVMTRTFIIATLQRDYYYYYYYYYCY